MKRKKQEKEGSDVQKAAQWTEFIEEIQKVNNPLTKHTEPESLQRFWKILQVVSNYYMMRNTSKIALKNDAKNQSQQQLTRKKLSHGHVCPGHWKVWC